MTASMMTDLDAARESLQRWMRGQPAFGPDIELVAVYALTKGQSSDMMELLCRYRGEDALTHFILRREPRGRQLFLKPDIPREYAVLRALELEGSVPVPPMLACETSDAVLGAPFLVMGKVEGFVPLGKPSVHVAGPLLGLDAETRRRLWLSAMKGLVAVHALDWQTVMPFMAEGAAQVTPLRAHVETLTQWYQWAAAGRKFPVTDAALAYLRAECARVENQPSVLLWNDARIGNMIFAQSGELAAVIDWEAAIVGPAAIDLGYWLMMDEFHAEAIGVRRLPGLPDREETIRTYETLSGRTVHDLDYFVVRAAFFTATTLIRQADLAIAAGRYAADSRMAYDNSVTQIIARQLGLLVPPMSPDFIAHRQLQLLDSGSA